MQIQILKLKSQRSNIHVTFTRLRESVENNIKCNLVNLETENQVSIFSLNMKNILFVSKINHSIIKT